MYSINATFVTSCNTTKVRALVTENRGSASHQSSANLAKQFQIRRLLEIGQSETRIVWRPSLSTDRDEMCNLYRRPSKVASFQVAVDLTRQFEKRIFYQICQLETRIVCGDHVC